MPPSFINCRDNDEDLNSKTNYKHSYIYDLSQTINIDSDIFFASSAKSVGETGI